MQATCTTLAKTPPPAPIANPEWLREWREIPKLEVFAKDLPDHEDPHQRAIAAVILEHIQSGQPFTFRYDDHDRKGFRCGSVSLERYLRETIGTNMPGFGAPLSRFSVPRLCQIHSMCNKT